MTTELRKARRELGKLKDRLAIISAGGSHWRTVGMSMRIWKVSNAFYRDLARQIKRQELKVRRLELSGPWTVLDCPFGGWYVQRSAVEWRRFEVHNSLARAITWAERQNRKAAKK